jgi:formylglycine-generating enzyme required for sulfatase activity
MKIHANNKLNFKLLILLFILPVISTAFFSCNNNDLIITESGKPSITKVVKDTTFIGDTITIYGENFGDRNLSSFVVFNDSTIIHSSLCLKWTISQITLIVPNTNTQNIFVVAKNDTSNSFTLIINELPPLDTVEVSSGKITIGSLFGYKDEQPPHDIYISKPLICSKFEINQLFYKQVVGYNPSLIKDNSLPVDSISWVDAIQFCNKLSTIQGLKPVYTIFGDKVNWDTTANGWRLPTEAEWEYLCRAGSNYDYSSSTNLADDGWYNMNSGLHSHSSGLKLPNAFGLYDMHGNLWEWCWDFYSSDYYSQSPYQDPKGPETGSRHIARGGSYADGNSFARASNRYYTYDAIPRTGIRIVRNK